MKTCRCCENPYQPTPAQLRKSDYICPPCRRSNETAWRAKRKDAGRPVVTGSMPRAYHKAYEAEYTSRPDVRARRAEQMRGYAKAHGTAEHHKARRAVRTEIEAGRLVRQPCEVCGASPAHAHHDDYSKPLAVRWLCPAHHREHHAKTEGSASTR